MHLASNMPVLPLRKRRIIIDDSDSGIPMKVLPLDGSAIELRDPQIAAAAIAVTAASASPATVATAAPAPPIQMNQYFSQFPALASCVLESAPPSAPCDADVTDLRLAVPPQSCQFLDLEARHMAFNSDDTSGETGDESSCDGSSFIDDSPVDLTTDDVAYIARFTAKSLPMTAARLLATPLSLPPPLTSGSSGSEDETEHLARPHHSRVVLSSSSGSDSDPVSQGARRHLDIRTEVRLALQQLPAASLPSFLAGHGASNGKPFPK
jgi:hypothetical protein